VGAPKRFIEHHHCHAATAYYCSQFGDVPEEVLVLTADGVGDGICHSFATVERNHRLVRQSETMIFHSIAEVYGYVTHNLGFRYNRHEGKITGLAAYGNPAATVDVFRRVMDFDAERMELRCRLGAWGRPGAQRLARLLAGHSREDVAAGLQRALEEVMQKFVSTAMKRYRKRYLCVAGGLFANVRVNQVLREIPGVEDIYVHPGMADTGQGLGAALGLWADLEPHPKPILLRDVYLGPSYSNEEIERALRANGVRYRRCADTAAEVAGLLAAGKVVARFVGRMEYGPRALGHRSILYHTADRSVNDWLNKRLQRTEFMPFAPIVRRERAAEYFADFDPERAVCTDFMTITYDVTPKGASEAPAATHVDGTARPQTVSRDRNPDSWQILVEYERLTGRGVLINTSFNMHEEPIVCTPDDAIRAFNDSRIDALAIGDFVATLPEGSTAAASG
jgi:carbamoyltransferase